jgi:peptidoglycan/xylan/chitin deacetylase (PgdA/CDA1 family)
MGRKWTGTALVAAAVAALLAVPGPAVAGTNTYVSLTFDDGRANTYPVKDMLASHGMRGTFYIISGSVGTSSYYLTWPQIGEFASAGNEIAGHTVNHRNLTTLTSEQARAEVCDDRQNLIGRGYNPISFAYPEGAYNTTVEQIVRDCGYLDARIAGNAPYGAETIPPRDAYAVRTPTDIKTTTTLADMQSMVTSVENNGGGWVIYLFHSVCNACDSLSVSQSQLGAFLDWLQPRSALGTQVRTMGEMTTNPPPAPPAAPTGLVASARNGSAALSWTASSNPSVVGYDVYRATTSGGPYTKITAASIAQPQYTDTGVTNGVTYYYAVTASDASGNESRRSSQSAATPHADLLNPSLEADANGDGVPDCWAPSGYGTNVFSFARTADSHSGSWAERTEISSFTNGDRKLVVRQDNGDCGVPVVPGHAYRLTAWYKATVPTYFVSFTRSSTGSWPFWRSSPGLPAAADWAQATWTTPVIPAGTTHLSFGLNLAQAGFIIVDDFSVVDLG